MELKCLDFFFTFVYYRNFLKIKWRNLNRGLVHCQKRKPSREEVCGDSSSTLRELQCSLGERRFTFCSESCVLPDFCSGSIFMQSCICYVVSGHTRYTGPYLWLGQNNYPQLFQRRDMRQVRLCLGYKKDLFMGTLFFLSKFLWNNWSSLSKCYSQLIEVNPFPG